jgi:hypothetical protein
MMLHWIRSSAFIAALAFTTAAPAQNEPEEGDKSEIIVTGNRDVERQALDFARAMAPGGPVGQIARFEPDVCPFVFGLAAGEKAAVERRLRVVAEAAGIPVAKTGCTPNALVMVTSSKSAFLDALLRSHPYYFGDLSSSEIRRLMRAPGPAAAWQLQGEVNGRGTAVRGSGGGVPVNRSIDPGSRITAATRPIFEAAALVVEKGALDGLTTTQLADYAAMRLFAKTDPARLADPAAPTIVKVLDAPMGSEVPLTLTKWDLGFLRGLYASSNNLYAAAQRSEIAKEIKKEVRRLEDEPAPAPAARAQQ